MLQAPDSKPHPPHYTLLPFQSEHAPRRRADATTRYVSKNGTAIFTKVTPPKNKIDSIHVPLYQVLCDYSISP